MTELLTLSEAAERIDMRPKALRMAVERQELPAVGGCGELLLDADEVHRWLCPDEPPGPPPEAEYRALLLGDPCCYCGGSMDHVDHIVPQSAGGSNAWSNLTAACRSCNGKKAAKPLLVFLLGDAGLLVRRSREPVLCAKCGETVESEKDRIAPKNTEAISATSDFQDPWFVRRAEQAAHVGDQTPALAWLLACLDHATQVLDEIGSNVDARVVEAHRAQLARGQEWPGDPITSPECVEHVTPVPYLGGKR